jgi:hypothetical protein
MSQRRRRALAQWPAPTSVRHIVCIRHFPHQELIWCSDLARSSPSTEPECLRGFEIDDQFILGLGPRQSHRRLQQGFATGEMGSGVSLHGTNLEPLMSALGQKQRSRPEIAMSALPPKADIAGRQWNVRFVPKADISSVWKIRILGRCTSSSDGECP